MATLIGCIGITAVILAYLFAIVWTSTHTDIGLEDDEEDQW